MDLFDETTFTLPKLLTESENISNNQTKDKYEGYQRLFV
jgi:hypothetical protein